MNVNTHYKRGFLRNVLGIVIILAIVGVFYYFSFYKKTTYVSSSRLINTTVTNTDESTETGDTITYVSTIDAEFEEHYQVAFQFSYPKSLFKVKATPDGKNITISELTHNKDVTGPDSVTGSSTDTKAATTTHSVTISFEGGRGYSPDDYWKNMAKKTCGDCIKSRDPFQIDGMDKTVTYENNKKIIYIAQAPKNSPFLFIFEIQKPSGSVIQALKSFAFR